jgi:hypothetical protein
VAEQQATAQSDDLSKYEVKPGDDLSKYEVKTAPTTDTTYHSNPSFGNFSAPDSPVRTTAKSPEKQAQSDIAAPARHEPIPAPVRMVIENAPLIGGGLEAAAAGKLLPFAGRAATGLVGSIVGAGGGKAAGRYLAGDTGGKFGEALGGVGGMFAGAGGFGEDARAIGNPRKLPFIGAMMPDLLEESPPMTLPEKAFDTAAAERGITPFEGVGKAPPPPPPESIRRVPGQIQPETVGTGPMRVPAIATQGGDSLLPGGGVIRRQPLMLSAGGPLEPAPEVPKTSLRSLANDVVSRNITPEPGLKPNVPLREQPDIGRGTPGSRVAMEVKPRTVAPEKLPTAITEEAGRQMGAPPLQKNVSLREQIKNPSAGGAVESDRARLQRIYPDSGIRQIVHSEGEKLVQAAGGDRETLKAVHDLTNAEIRQAAINSGEDLGQTSVGSRKAVGNQVGRIELLDKMLAKGHTPSEIVRLAKQPIK